MIPSYVSRELIQYRGYIKLLTPDLDRVNKIRVVDYKTQAILFNSEVIMRDKRDWSLNQENRYCFSNIYNDETSIYFVTDKESNKIKIMSLDNNYKRLDIGNLSIQYKAEYKESIRTKDDNLYEINFDYGPIYSHDELEYTEEPETLSERLLRRYASL